MATDSDREGHTWSTTQASSQLAWPQYTHIHNLPTTNQLPANQQQLVQQDTSSYVISPPGSKGAKRRQSPPWTIVYPLKVNP